MKEAFSLVQLEPDEHIVFGIRVVSDSTEETRKGITNKRVVIEASMGYTTSIANSEVKRVNLARETRMAAPYLRIVSIQDSSGRTHPIGLGGIDPDLEPRLHAMFPLAKLKTKNRNR